MNKVCQDPSPGTPQNAPKYTARSRATLECQFLLCFIRVFVISLNSRNCTTMHYPKNHKGEGGSKEGNSSIFGRFYSVI